MFQRDILTDRYYYLGMMLGTRLKQKKRKAVSNKCKTQLKTEGQIREEAKRFSHLKRKTG
jgi:hypothetical protein